MTWIDSPKALLVLTFLTATLLMPFARADSLYFSRGSSTTWTDDGTTQNWATSAGGPYNASAWIGGSDAHFEGTAGTVTASGTIASVNSISFDVSGYTLTGGIVTLTGDAIVHSNAGGWTTVESVLAGSSGFTKTGTGEIVLRAVSTYTGDTVIGQGRIILGSGDNRLPTGTTVVLGGDVNSGVLSLGSTVTNRNQTLAGLATSGTGTGNRVVGAGTTTYSTLRLNIADTNVFDGILGGAGSNENCLNLVKLGAGTLTLSGVNTYLGTTTVSAGTLLIQGSGRIASASNVSIASGATFEVAATDWAMANNISGDGGLTKSGSAGDLRLTGNNTYTGPTLATGTRILRAGSSQAFGVNSALTVESGATVELNGYSLAFGSIAGNGTIRNITGSYGSGSDNPTVLTTGGNNASTTFSGTIQDGAGGRSVGLVKAGMGTFTLTGMNTYTGTTAVNAGTLLLDGSLSGTSGVTVATGATLGGSGTIAAAVSGAGLLSPGSSPGILTISQFNPLSGLSAALEFTAIGSPNYGDALASVNDVLRITGATPFSQPLAAGNTIDVYFDLANVTAGDTFLGGFYTDAADDFFPSIENASFAYWVTGDGLGTDRTFNGQGYHSLDHYASWLSVELATVAETADFGADPIYGRVAQFSVVPEPTTPLLLAIGILILGVARARGHRTAWPVGRPVSS